MLGSDRILYFREINSCLRILSCDIKLHCFKVTVFKIYIYIYMKKKLFTFKDKMQILLLVFLAIN